MSEETGFTTMTGEKARGEAPEIGVGMLGYAFMGKAHTNAYKTIPYMIYPPPAIPKLVGICGLVEDEAAEASRRYGYESYYTDRPMHRFPQTSYPIAISLVSHNAA